MDRDVAALRVTREEARATLDHQIATLNDVDAKAASTLRFALGFIGLLLTGLSTVGATALGRVADGVSHDPATTLLALAVGLVGVALALFAASMYFAMETYTTTRFRAGVRPTDIDRLLDENYSEEEWLYLLNDGYADWIAFTQQRNLEDTRTLEIAQRSFQAGVVTTVVAVTIYGSTLLL